MRNARDAEKLEVIVDSGAVDHVIPEKELPGIPTMATEVSKKGMYYVAANGGKIYNKGIKIIEGETENGINACMKFQVAGVTKALGSVKKICEAGNRVVFEDGNSYIEDKKSGTRTKIKEENGRYVMELFIGNRGRQIGGQNFTGLEDELI
jgi:hypothetical protein